MHASGDSVIGKLVERQMRNWELARAQRLSAPEPEAREVEDFISISRCVGTAGDEVAAALGEKLGWPVFDKELLEVMGGDDELRRQVYDSMDERDLGWCEEALRSLIQPEFVRNDYFRRLTETVLSLARQGHAVFLGRGADLILPMGVGLRVRLVASFDTCAAGFAIQAGLPIEEARATVTQLEKERAEFIRHHFGVDPADAARHDLVINLDRRTPGQAVELILAARELAAAP